MPTREYTQEDIRNTTAAAEDYFGQGAEGMPTRVEKAAEETALLKSNADSESEFAPFGDTPVERALEPTEEATPEEEAQKKIALGTAGEFLYGTNIAKVAKHLQRDGNLKYAAANLAFEILKKSKMEIEAEGSNPSPAVFFAETGALPDIIEMIFEVAQKAGLPGSEAEETKQAATMGAYGMMGQYLEEIGDTESLAQAQELGFEMMFGPINRGPDAQPDYIQTNLRKKKVAEATGSAIDSRYKQ